jgi:hypothetical protein
MKIEGPILAMRRDRMERGEQLLWGSSVAISPPE